MKRALISLSMLLTLSITVHGQGWINRYYQNKRLSDLNSEELSFLLTKATGTLNTGIVLACVGGGSVLIGGGIFLITAMKDLEGVNYSGDSVYITAIIITAIGGVIALTGIPILMIGANRKDEILRALNSIGKKAVLQIRPFMEYNRAINSNCSGLTVSLRF